MTSRMTWMVSAAIVIAAASMLSAQPATQPATGAVGAAAEAQPAPPPPDEGSTASEDLEQHRSEAFRRSWFAQVFGWGMIPLWACSIVLVALIFERRKALKPGGILDASMVDRVADLVSELKVDHAQRHCGGSGTVLGRAWAKGFHEFQLGGMSLSESLTNSTLLAFKPLRRNLQALATLGVISPLLGLLGTILGMIIIFGQIAATGGADKSRLAGGIGLALFTTAGGLIVAIPAILANRYFTARLTALADQAEEAISRVCYRYSHASAQAQSAPGSPGAEPRPAKRPAGPAEAKPLPK